jgi:hypothetical protein
MVARVVSLSSSMLRPRSLWLASSAAFRVIGGRYGLGDMMFTPAMARAVFLHARNGGRSDFIVGPKDDMTGRSIEYEPLTIRTVPEGTVRQFSGALAAMVLLEPLSRQLR